METIKARDLYRRLQDGPISAIDSWSNKHVIQLPLGKLGKFIRVTDMHSHTITDLHMSDLVSMINNRGLFLLNFTPESTIITNKFYRIW